MTRPALSQDLTDDLIATAHAMAEAARAVILPYFRTVDLAAENKLAGGFDPVTEADRAAEAAMRAHIEAAQRVRVRALRARPAQADTYDGDLL